MTTALVVILLVVGAGKAANFVAPYECRDVLTRLRRAIRCLLFSEEGHRIAKRFRSSRNF